MERNNHSGGSAAAAEQGEVLRVVVQHYREMKRQETCSRWITALLALTIFTGFLWLQVSAHGNKDDVDRQAMTDTGVVKALSSAEPKPKIKPRHVSSIHLLTAESSEQTVPSQDMNSFAVRWKTPQVDSKFRLEQNETCVVVPAKGWYLVSVRILYRVPEETSTCRNSVCFLTVFVSQYNNDYRDWRDIVVGQETMRWESGWRQTVILNRVINLKSSTKLRVNVDNTNHKLISWGILNYFEVTRL